MVTVASSTAILMGYGMGSGLSEGLKPRPEKCYEELMKWLTLSELSACADQYDAAIAKTPDIDRFCSSAPWIVSAAQALLGEPEPFITQSPDGFVAMMIIEIADGMRAAVPLEIGWGLAAPFAGANPQALVAQLDQMWATRHTEVDALIVSGIPNQSLWAQQLVSRYISTKRIGLGESCMRRMASLHGGLHGFMNRRSANFRAKLRRAERRGAEAGLQYTYHRADPDGLLFKRILAIEADSWKGRLGEGFNQPPSANFYEQMTARLHDNGALRIVMAQLDEQDIGFVFGGVFQGVYRGLQMSYRADYAALEPGNLGQLMMLKKMIEEGVSTYDLGTDLAYKNRWAELSLETQLFAIMPAR